jgi:Domain of unknown function (DUF5666)/Domain of unknown function (DUF4382)
MEIRKGIGLFLAALLVVAVSGCANSSSSTQPPASAGNVFTLGTDAPPTLPGVISFQVMITGVSLANSSGSISVLSNPETIDFAKLSGLHQLLDLDQAAQGTYTQVIITGSTPVIGYIDTTQSPPALNTISATPSTFSVTVPLTKPLVVDQNDMVGLLIDLDLRQTIQVSNGQVTGAISPTFIVTGLTADDSEAWIDCFRGGVVSTDSSSNTFTMQGGHGRQWNVTTNAQTEWDGGASFSNLAVNDIVEVSGTLDRVTHAIDANEVEILSQDGFFMGGLITYVNPSSPAPATEMQMYVRDELPDLSPSEPLGAIDTLTLDGSEKYYIADFHNPLTDLLFNNMTLAPGQRVGVGGKLNAGSNPAVTVKRVVLERQAQEGNWVVGSTQIQSGNTGSFQIDDNYLAGILLPQPLTVFTSSFTNFVNLSGLSALGGTQAIPLRIVGFVLVNQQTNQAVMVARRVEVPPTAE